MPYAYTFNLTKVMAPHVVCKVCSSRIKVLWVTYPLGVRSQETSCSSKDGTEFVRFQTLQKATASAAVKTVEEVLLHKQLTDTEKLCVCVCEDIMMYY